MNTALIIIVGLLLVVALAALAWQVRALQLSLHAEWDELIEELDELNEIGHSYRDAYLKVRTERNEMITKVVGVETALWAKTMLADALREELDTLRGTTEGETRDEFDDVDSADEADDFDEAAADSVDIRLV